MNYIKKTIYFLCVIILLYLLTVFPYLILNFLNPDLNIERIILSVYMVISGYILAEYWWNYVYVQRKTKKTFLSSILKK